MGRRRCGSSFAGKVCGHFVCPALTVAACRASLLVLVFFCCGSRPGGIPCVQRTACRVVPDRGGDASALHIDNCPAPPHPHFPRAASHGLFLKHPATHPRTPLPSAQDIQPVGRGGQVQPAGQTPTLPACRHRAPVGCRGSWCDVCIRSAHYVRARLATCRRPHAAACHCHFRCHGLAASHVPKAEGRTS